MTRLLIVNADDDGLTEGISREIVHAAGFTLATDADLSHAASAR